MRLLAGLLVLAVVAVVGDRILAAEVEQRAAAVASDTLAAPVEVELRGFPMALHLLRGRIPQAELTARGVPIGDRDGLLPLLRVRLTQVAVALRADGAGRLPPAEAGVFHAEADGPALASVVGAPAELGEVTIHDGEVRFAADGITVVMVPAVEAGRLALTLDRVEAAAGSAGIPPELRPEFPRLTADLSELPGVPVVERVRALPGVLVLDGRLSRLTPPR